MTVWMFTSNGHAEASCVKGTTACVVAVDDAGELVATRPWSVPRSVVQELYRRHDERRLADPCTCSTCRMHREFEARRRPSPQDRSG